MKVKILVIEDDKDMCALLTDGLESQGYEVTSGHSYNDAESALKKDTFNILISDLNMPGKSGIELCKYVKSVNPQTEIIVITAFGTVDTAIEAIKSGAYDFISKPFELEKIYHTVTRTLEVLDLRNKVETFDEIQENHSKELLVKAILLQNL